MIAYTFSADGSPEWRKGLLTGDTVRFVAQEIRRERTGVHALVGIGLADSLLAYDNFNVARSEERTRLARAAHRMFGPMLAEGYPLPELTHDLDLFCLGLGQAWEEQRFTEDLFDVDGTIAPIRRVLWPYVIDGGGSIFFSAPGSGKSYLALAMALSIGAGISRLWRVERPRPVLFVNLERDGASMKRRLQLLCRIFGVRGTEHGVIFLNARGQSLAAVERKARTFMAAHTDGVLFVDSISRAGQGSLVDDETANRIVDLLNRVCRTWVAIGHTSRASDDHIYGSIHFDAGEDIGVKVDAERRGNTLGLSLQMVKANDVPHAPAEYLAFEFSQYNDDPEDTYLTDIRRAAASEFPELATGRKRTGLERLIDHMLAVGESTTKAAAEATGLAMSLVSDAFIHSGQFVRLRKAGKEVFYGLLADYEGQR